MKIGIQDFFKNLLETVDFSNSVLEFEAHVLL